MTYYGAKEIADSFRTVRNNTITIAEDIPEGKYSFRATPDTRSVGEMLVHIAQGYAIQYKVHAEERLTTIEGFDFPAMMQWIAAEEKMPRSKSEIVALLKSTRDKWAGWVEGLNDDFLGERVAMRPGMVPASKSRFEMIISLKEHEMHHRAQLMLMERLLGVMPHMTRAMNERMVAAVAAVKP
jgi:uncharacterized damage-inducible protein DinB